MHIYVWSAEWLRELTANAQRYYCYYFNNTAQEIRYSAGNAKICHTDTSFPHGPSSWRWTVVLGQICSDLHRWPQALEWCYKPLHQCKHVLCKHVLSSGEFVERTAKTSKSASDQLRSFLRYFPLAKYLHGSSLTEQLLVWNLWSSFFVLQDVCFLPVFAFLGTAEAPSVAEASCQLCFSTSLLWAWCGEELGQEEYGQFWLWVVGLRSLSAGPKPLKTIQLSSWPLGNRRGSPEGEHVAGLSVFHCPLVLALEHLVKNKLWRGWA